MAATVFRDAWVVGAGEGDRTRNSGPAALGSEDVHDGWDGAYRIAHVRGRDRCVQGRLGVISEVLGGIAGLPTLPSEAEDILTISSRERHKWVKDGRLKSIGTRTVKLRGRAKAVTFHVFDPRQIEAVLDGDLPAIWREQDAQALAETRRRAAGKAAQTRASKPRGKAGGTRKAREDAPRSQLDGWDVFEAQGLLR